jgi:hypothetical protein
MKELTNQRRNNKRKTNEGSKKEIKKGTNKTEQRKEVDTIGF